MKKHDVIIACDFPDAQQTLDFLRQFQQEKPFVKIGMELFTAKGRISCARSRAWATTSFWI